MKPLLNGTFGSFSPLLVFQVAAEFASFNQQTDKESRMNENAALFVSMIREKPLEQKVKKFHLDLTWECTLVKKEFSLFVYGNQAVQE